MRRRMDSYDTNGKLGLRIEYLNAKVGTLMSIFPNTPLAGRVKTLILATFDVPEDQAQDYAAYLTALAVGWGSPEKAENLDWSYRIKKDLGHKLRWKSEEEREAFFRSEQEKYAAYDSLIRRPPRA